MWTDINNKYSKWVLVNELIWLLKKTQKTSIAIIDLDVTVTQSLLSPQKCFNFQLNI